MVASMCLGMDFTLRGYPDITLDMILQNWQTVVKTLSIRRKGEITMSRSIGVPLGMLRLPPFQLLQIARDIIVCLQRLHEARILHWDVSINSIMCTLKMGENIVLEGGASRASFLSATLRASDIPHNSASNISLFLPRAVVWIFHPLEKIFLHTTATPVPPKSSLDPSTHNAESDLSF